MMSLYSFVLYTHVVATLGLFAGLGIEWLIVLALRRTTDARELRTWIEYWPQLSRLVLASVVLVVIDAHRTAERRWSAQNAGYPKTGFRGPERPPWRRFGVGTVP